MDKIKSTNWYDSKLWVEKVINSVSNVKQYSTCYKLINNWYKTYSNELDGSVLRDANSELILKLEEKQFSLLQETFQVK